MHNGKEALEHMNNKYAYYVDNIEATEDFIKYSATKRKMSGEYDHIHCSNKLSIKSQDGLLAELMVYSKAKIVH